MRPSQPAARSPMPPPAGRSRRSSASAPRYVSSIAKARRSRSPASPQRAQVSRAFLYQHGELRAEIEALRTAQAAAPAPMPVRQRASDASLRARLRAALDESQRQREEIARLREELALAHGRVRELELDRRVRRT